MAMVDEETQMVFNAKEVAREELTDSKFKLRKEWIAKMVENDGKAFTEKTGLDPKFCLNLYGVLENDEEPEMLPPDFFDDTDDESATVQRKSIP